MASTPGRFFPRDVKSDAEGNVYLGGGFAEQPLALNGVRLAAVGVTEEAFVGRVLLVSGIDGCVHA